MRMIASARIVRFATMVLLTMAALAAVACAWGTLLGLVMPQAASHPGAPVVDALPRQAPGDEAPEGVAGQAGPGIPGQVSSQPVQNAPSGTADVLTQLQALAGQGPYLEAAVLSLARVSLEASVLGTTIPEPHGLLQDVLPDHAAEALRVLTSASAGAFVTALSQNKVRACVGSMWPTTSSIAREIGHFAAMAAARDLRRSPLDPAELDGIELAVSIVGRIERAQRGDMWDPAAFGIFVRAGQRTGVILPGEALTHAKQLSWALAEAGIPEGSPYEAYRFQTVKFGASLEMRH
jgi:AMMECR1 domain-containing protein